MMFIPIPWVVFMPLVVVPLALLLFEHHAAGGGLRGDGQLLRGSVGHVELLTGPQ